jgi:hypothetical protein
MVHQNDVHERMLAHPSHRIDEMLPHNRTLVS